MNPATVRSYRKNLVTNGFIYINGEERGVSISNISMTGMLVQLSNTIDTEIAFNDSLLSTTIDFFLPKLNLTGTAELVRVTPGDVQATLAFKFIEITYNINKLLYKRKFYRKNMSVPGRILLDNVYHDFYTVNVSLDGMMIRLTDAVDIAGGMTTTFESAILSLKGEVEIVWATVEEDNQTVAGLKFIDVDISNLKGIPSFSTDNN